MVTKFIIRGFSKKFKGVQKLKPQKVEVRRELLTDKQIKLRQQKIADQNIRETFGADSGSFSGVTARSLETLRGESVALNLANRKFFTRFGSELKSSRKRTAIGIKGRKLKVKTPTAPTFKQKKAGILKGSGLPKSKAALKMAKSKGATQSLKIATKKSDEAFVKITQRFTARAKASPFKNRTIAAKRPLTGFDGEQAQSAKFIFDSGLAPPNYYKGLSKTGKISKQYAKFIDKSKKFK